MRQHSSTTPTLSTSTRQKLGKVLPLLSSDKDGEVVAAARAVSRILREAKLDWHDLSATIVAEIDSASSGARAKRAPSGPPNDTSASDPWKDIKEEHWFDSDHLDDVCVRVRKHGRLSSNAEQFLSGLQERAEKFMSVKLSEKQFAWLADLFRSATGEVLRTSKKDSTEQKDSTKQKDSIL